MLYIETLKGKIEQVNEWKDINEIIVRLMFKINNKEMIVLEGFESYLRLKEHVHSINSDLNGISKIILCGKIQTHVAKITIDLIKKKVIQEKCYIYDVYNKKPIDKIYWRKGLGINPKIYIKKI